MQEVFPMKIHLNVVSDTDGALLDVIKIDEALYRQAQQAVSCYGITLIEYLELCFQKLKLLPQDKLKDCLTRLAAESRMQSDPCFWCGSGRRDPILTYFCDWGESEL